MKYITSQEASFLWGITQRRIQQMCKNGQIDKAKKEGKVWLIPENTNVSTHLKEARDTSKKKPLPIGISEYKKAVSEYYYVDKTLMIKDFLDDKPKVSLFTRPRRFGKTMAMDMFRVFFEKTEEDTSKYFKNKAIWKCGKYYTSYQGEYPVIFLTFKDVKCADWQSTYEKLSKLIALEFLRHSELEFSSKLSSYEKEQYTIFARCKASPIDYEMSLQILSLLLYKHYNKDCVIIVDEYDTPIQHSRICGFYKQVIDFMRNFFSGGLKDNNYLAFGFLTGILRVAKESIFSGLNNLKVNTILDNAYSQYFGFTKSEVKAMFEYYDSSDKFQEVCDWYDGYLFGNTDIFNPWSVINYISNKCFPQAFWQATGSNDIIGEIIDIATPEVKEELQKLLMNESVTTYVDTNVVYPELNIRPYSIYSFLLMTGYLKVNSITQQNDGNYMCDIAIPNREIAFVYEREIISKMGKNSIVIDLQKAIIMNDITKFQTLLEKFMVESISYYDSATEGFYHGMMLGLCAALSNKYHIKSNGESGYGRFDIALYPENKNMPGLIFEFKRAKNEAKLNKMAEVALSQIETSCYDTQMKEIGVENIIKIGMAFFGKKASMKSL